MQKKYNVFPPQKPRHKERSAKRAYKASRGASAGRGGKCTEKKGRNRIAQHRSGRTEEKMSVFYKDYYTKSSLFKILRHV